MKADDRLLLAVAEDRLVITMTDRFAPVAFMSDINGIQRLREVAESVNDSFRSGTKLPGDAEELYTALLRHRSNPAPVQAVGCGDSCACSATAASKKVELFLILAQYCNLGCVYCLEGDETYQKKRNGRMTLETAIQAVDGTCEMLKPGDVLAITFFGGEPLLNWKLIPQILAHATAKCRDRLVELVSGIQTNLSFLPPGFTDVANQYGIKIIGNIDGPEDIHNRLRPHRDPSANSYRSTVKCLERLRDNGVPFNLRATVTSLNDGTLADVADLHRSLGAAKSTFGLLRPLNSDGIIFDDSLLPDLDRYATSLRQLMQRHPVTLEGPLSAMLGRMSVERDSRACGAAHILTPTVDANGDVYSCAWFVGQPNRRLGNVADARMLKQAAVERTFDEFDPTKDQVCVACDYFPVCKGGCSATRLNADQSAAGMAVIATARAQQCTLTKTMMTELLVAATSN